MIRKGQFDKPAAKITQRDDKSVSFRFDVFYRHDIARPFKKTAVHLSKGKRP